LTAKDTLALDYRVPPDHGVVAPVAAEDEEVDDETKAVLEAMREALKTWPQAATADDVQNVRYLLCVAGVPDAIQMPLERYVPRVVFDNLTDKYPKDRLVKMLTWIVLHPEDGAIVDDISELGITGTVGDPSLVRERSYLYALKLLLRLNEK
jgi:hypothetical protein